MSTFQGDRRLRLDVDRHRRARHRRGADQHGGRTGRRDPGSGRLQRVPGSLREQRGVMGDFLLEFLNLHRATFTIRGHLEAGPPLGPRTMVYGSRS